jgi:ABC-2 type transport system permease protein
MLVRLTVTGVAALLMLLLSGRAWPAPGVLAALAVAGPLGAFVGLLLLMVAGLSAFWVRRTLPAMLVIQKATFLLGGLLAPITLYPPWLARLGAASPFAAHLYWPAALTLSPSPRTLALVLGAQGLWIALLIGLISLIWRAGVRRALRGEL